MWLEVTLKFRTVSKVGKNEQHEMDKNCLAAWDSIESKWIFVLTSTGIFYGQSLPLVITIHSE